MTVVGDGLQTRDYTYVGDVVEANILAAENESIGNSEVINIGTGTNYSVLDLVEMINGEYVHIPERPGEARETLADITRATKLLNWKPLVDLKQWIREYYN